MPARILLCLYVLLVAVACSNAEPESDFTPNAVLDSSNISDGSSVQKTSFKVYARDGFHRSNMKVNPGDRILIKTSSLWSGGQVELDETQPDNNRIIECGPNGCNGEIFKATGWEQTSPNLDSSGNPTDGIRVRRLAGDVKPHTDIGVRYCGIGGPRSSSDPNAGGAFDGATLCYSANNVLLGDDVPGLENDGGYWLSQRSRWDSYYYFLVHGDADPTLTSIVRDIRDLYEDSTCSNPVSVEELRTKFAEMRAIPDMNIQPTENVYDVAYVVEVPENNYGPCCNSSHDIILEYRYGLPSKYIRKNECVEGEGALNTLIMKIVADGVNHPNVAPIIVGDRYETTAYEVTTPGYLYFSNNDLQSGHGDNRNFLEVSIEKLPNSN